MKCEWCGDPVPDPPRGGYIVWLARLAWYCSTTCHARHLNEHLADG